MKIKSNLPISKIILPISKKTVHIRPYTLKEEKILLIAKDAKSPDEFSLAMVQLVDSCSTDLKESSAELPLADLVWLFVQIRAKSVGEISELTFTCKKELEQGKICNGSISYDLDLNKLGVRNASISNVVTIDPEIGLGIKLKYVSVSSMSRAESEDDATSQIKLIYDLMECLFDNENTETKADITFDEFKEFIETLPKSQLKNILDFINSNPMLSETINLKCPNCGNETQYTLEGVNDFF